MPINIYMVKDSKLKSNILLLEKKKENLNCDNWWKTGETIGRAEVRKVVKRDKDNLLKWQRASGEGEGNSAPTPSLSPCHLIACWASWCYMVSNIPLASWGQWCFSNNSKPQRCSGCWESELHPVQRQYRVLGGPWNYQLLLESWIEIV